MRKHDNGKSTGESVSQQQDLTEFDELDDVPLPEALVSDVLGEMDRCADFAGDVLDASENFKDDVREDLADRITDLDNEGPAYDSVTGVDGSYTSIDGTGVTIGICSAVGAGEEFQYNKEVFPSPASQDLTIALKGISTILEMKTAGEANEEMVIYDGSFITTLVSLNQLLQRREQQPNQGLWEAIDSLLVEYFRDSRYFLNALKDTVIIGSPKRSPSTRFLNDNYPEYVDRFSDRAFFSRILEEGEYILTQRTEGGTNYARESFYINDETSREVEDFYDEQGFVVCFYKPKPWSRAYRLEIPKSPETNNNYEKIMRTYGEQVIDPSMFEPYPQWLADVMCKKITNLSGMLKDGIQNKLSDEGYDTSEVNTLLQGYRTEMQ